MAASADAFDEPSTLKRRRFVTEYLKDLNGTQAAIRAGYSESSAGQIAHELLKKPEIQNAIAEAEKRRSERTKVTVDRVVNELAKMAFANLDDYVQLQEDGSAVVDLSMALPDQMAALTEIAVDEYTEGRGEDARDVKRVKIKLADKQGALQMLGRHLGMFDDRLRLSGKVELENLSDDELERRLAEGLVAAGKDRPAPAAGGAGEEEEV